jgi:hypothetical protein
MLNQTVILPYQHIKMKDGGSFWSWCGCSATDNMGTKKRFNGAWESRSMQIRFNEAVKAYCDSKQGITPANNDTSLAPQKNANTAYSATPFIQRPEYQTQNGQNQSGGAAVDQNLPF